jgi:hypothetical protein
MATIIRLTISYTLAEYLSFVQDHLQPGTLSRALIVAAATLSFLLKKSTMPICDFVITDEHIRRTNVGELIVPWAEVRAVHRYSQGFLVEKAKGGLPLPYRCFSTSERADFDRLVAKYTE